MSFDKFACSNSIVGNAYTRYELNWWKNLFKMKHTTYSYSEVCIGIGICMVRSSLAVTDYSRSIQSNYSRRSRSNHKKTRRGGTAVAQRFMSISRIDVKHTLKATESERRSVIGSIHRPPAPSLAASLILLIFVFKCMLKFRKTFGLDSTTRWEMSVFSARPLGIIPAQNIPVWSLSTDPSAGRSGGTAGAPGSSGGGSGSSGGAPAVRVGNPAARAGLR